PFALLPRLRLAGAAAEVGVGDSDHAGVAVVVAVGADGAAAEDRPDVSGFLPAAQVLPVLTDHVQHVVEPFAEDGPGPFHNQLLPIHARTSWMFWPPGRHGPADRDGMRAERAEV